MCPKPIQRVSDFSRSRAGLEPPRNARIYLGLVAVVAWFAIITQLVLMLGRQVVGLGEMLVRFFSYFTILTNVLVAVAASSLALGFGRWFRRPGVQSAIAVYIFVVGLVYNLVLRNIWDPTGLQRLVDDLLHVWVPVLYLVYWFIWTRRSGLRYSELPGWLIYPAIYAAWILVWGAMTGWYPYPFMDVVAFGYPTVFINSGVVLLVFLITSALTIFVGRFQKK